MNQFFPLEKMREGGKACRTHNYYESGVLILCIFNDLLDLQVFEFVEKFQAIIINENT